MRVELTETEMRDALVQAAAKKAGLYGKLIRHKVSLDGVWTRFGDNSPVVVEMEVMEEAVANDTVGVNDGG